MKLMQAKGASVPFHDSVADGRGFGLLLLPWRRLKAAKFSTVVFYLFGFLMIAAWMRFDFFWAIRQLGVGLWLVVVFVPTLLIPVVVFLAQHVAVDKAEDLTRNPLRFFAVMACATVAVYGVTWLYDAAFNVGIFCWYQKIHRFPDFFRFTVFYSLIAWLSCLYQQLTEGEARFATLSIRRSVLGRELAQSRLMAARSRIDPQMVVRVLRKIHALYESDQEAASKLMDHLISYLRMAMNRGREKSPSLNADVTIAKAYVALRAAETGMRVDFRAHFQRAAHAREEKAPAPVFLIIQNLFESCASGPEEPENVAVHVDVLETSVFLTLGSGERLLSDSRLACIRRYLAEVAPDSGDILHRISESGEHWYAVEIPIENGHSHRIDR